MWAGGPFPLIDLVIYLFKPQSSRTKLLFPARGIHAYNYKVQHARNYTKVQSNKQLQRRKLHKYALRI